MKATLKVTSDFTSQFNDVVRRFKNDEVLVGIPEQESARKKDEISNAALLAMANFGSPANNIPPWPVMALGIRAAREPIADQFKKAIQNAFKRGLPALDIYYNRAGILASNSIKKIINAQIEVPPDKPSKSTLASRKSRGFKGTKYWLVTGQMRNAITYVLRGNR